MSIIGHNDMFLLDRVCPPLTSVRIRNYEIGELGAKRLLDALAGLPPSGPEILKLQPELVVRASTAAPPKR